MAFTTFMKTTYSMAVTFKKVPLRAYSHMSHKAEDKEAYYHAEVLMNHFLCKKGPEFYCHPLMSVN